MRHTNTVQVVAAGDMSQATIPGAFVKAFNIQTSSYQAIWSGTSPVGTLQVQGVNLVSGTPGNDSTWSNIGSSVAVSGNSGSVLIPVIDIACDYLRILYTKTSGTGTLNITHSHKGQATS